MGHDLSLKIGSFFVGQQILANKATLGPVMIATLGCPKMHQLLKSHAPQAKSNGNHPTELAKSNKSPMG